MASPLDCWRRACGICALVAWLVVLAPTAVPVHAQTPEIESLGDEVSRLFKAGQYDKATPLAQPGGRLRALIAPWAKRSLDGSAAPVEDGAAAIRPRIHAMNKVEILIINPLGG